MTASCLRRVRTACGSGRVTRIIDSHQCRKTNRPLPQAVLTRADSQRGFNHVRDVEEILRIYRRAETHLCWPRQRADYQHRAAFMRNNFAAPLDLQGQSAGLRFDAREVVSSLDQIAIGVHFRSGGCVAPEL